jgi:transposase
MPQTRKSALAQSTTLSGGMEGPKEAIALAYGAQDHGAEVVSRGTIGPRQGAIAKRIRQLPSKSQQRGGVDAAGPCGSGLDRALTQQGHIGWVVAPSLLPQKPGDRVQTDRRDALQLARLLCSRDLTPVQVPAVDAAAIRGLRWARAEPLRELQAAKRRLQACVLAKVPGGTGIRPKSVGPCPCAWQSSPPRCRPSVGRPRSGSANGIAP